MKASRVLPFIFSLTILGSTALSGLDFDVGGSIDDYSSLPVTVAPGNAIFAPDQRNKVGVWADMHSGSTFSVAAEGSYNFTLQVPYLFNLDYLKVDWRVFPWLSTTLGRFVFSDFSGQVLNHTLDGALIVLDFPGVRISTGAGYSGLQLKPISLILMSRSDTADQSNSSVYLAAPRLIEKLEVLFPSLFSVVDVNLSVVLQQDLRASNQLIQPGEPYQTVTGLSGGALTTEYFGAGVSGAIVSSLYYNLFFYWNAGSALSYVADSTSVTGFSYQYEPVQAFLGGFGLRYYMEETLSSRVGLQAIFSSGDADNTAYYEGNTSGAATMFTPISQEVIGLAFTPQLGNLILIDLNYSFKPFAQSTSVWKNLQIIAKVLSFFRPTTGAISQPGLSATSTDLYLGVEPELIANFRPFSDFGVVVSTGVFVPNGGAFTGPATQPTIAGRIEFSMSF